MISNEGSRGVENGEKKNKKIKEQKKANFFFLKKKNHPRPFCSPTVLWGQTKRNKKIKSLSIFLRFVYNVPTISFSPFISTTRTEFLERFNSTLTLGNSLLSLLFFFLLLSLLFFSLLKKKSVWVYSKKWFLTFQTFTRARW